jgi:DNA ligase-1
MYNLLMKFAELCRYFERIEETSKRLEKTEILAELLKKIDHTEVRIVINLALGQLEAPYMRKQFNLAEKMLIRAMAQSLRLSVDEVTRRFKSVGDIGKVVWDMQREKEQGGSGREIGEIYQELSQIAEDSGTGSQERKQNKLAMLLFNASAIESKYIVRMINESLRLGFSESTMLDVLSYYVSGNKDYSKRLEQAYQLRPDVALLGEEIVGDGVEVTLQRASVSLGVPVIPALAQRLSTTEEMIEKMGRVYVEPKLDGVRVQIHFAKNRTQYTVQSTQQENNVLRTTHHVQQEMFEEEKPRVWVKTFTRNLDENTEQFPELLKIENEIGAESVILDAEAVGYDPRSGELLPFQMTITRKRKHGISEQQKNIPLRFFVFDIMYLNGESLINRPLSERRQVLERVLKPDVILALNPQIETDRAGIIRDYHALQLERGLEGVLVKKTEGRYDPGRSGFNWVKLKEVESAEGKLSDTIDCVVMGYYPGKGKRNTFGIGAFLVGVRGSEGQIMTIAKIGTGLSDEQFKELYAKLKKLEIHNPKLENYVVSESLIPDVWVKPEVIVEIAADEITKSPTHSAGYALRFPRLVKFREDKSVAESTTLTEIKQMYISVHST